jgi:3-keto-5-aminohexanoate cleavage enzyme
MTSCIGANPFPLYAFAIAKGGHVAVGLGDHAYPEFDLPSNAQLVERVVQMARSMGREIATAAETRALFGFASQ